MNGIPCEILKDDRASTNLISKDFYNRYKEHIVVEEASISLSHSSKSNEETDCKVTKKLTIRMGEHEYRSNFVLGDTRYNIILGTPSHNDLSPDTDYESRTIRIGNVSIQGKMDLLTRTSVSNISIRGFRKLVSTKGTEIFKAVIISVGPNEKQFGQAPIHPEMVSVVEEFSDVFQSTLPSGLPPKWSVDHEIETDTSVKIPNRRLFKLSPDELSTTREYIRERKKADELESARVRMGLLYSLRSNTENHYEQLLTAGY